MGAEIEVRAAARLVLSDQRQQWPADDAETLIYQAWDSASTTGMTLTELEEWTELAAAYRILLEYLNDIWNRRQDIGDVRAATRDLATNII